MDRAAFEGVPPRHDPRARAGVQRLLARAETRPITVAGQPLNAPLLRLYFRQLVQHTENDPALARSVRTLTDAAAGRPVTPDADLAGFLRLAGSSGLADLMVGGALFMCGDGGWPAGVGRGTQSGTGRTCSAAARTSPCSGRWSTG
ncbi:hypothetical protein ACFQHO_05050 [Actinomadura yumaensis]|uniref:hypothetical protein n=1 Tax=Actinomadura yumaensis TaxID=111807 RepID=UPI003620A644